MIRPSALVFAVLLSLTIGGMAHAVLPDERLDDPVLEERARVISKDIRCAVCQNQTIDDSNADLARDLRLLVRERLLAGDSNKEVKQFIVDRYGTYVLMTPPRTLGTALLWGGPFLILFLGGLIIWVWFRGRSQTVEASATMAQMNDQNDPQRPSETHLSADEKARLKRLLEDDT